MTHKSNITPATSPLLCNRTTYPVKRRLLIYSIDKSKIKVLLAYVAKRR